MLVDPNRNLSNWNRGDPCTSRWTGVLCFNETLFDGYLHVQELYDFCLFYLTFLFHSSQFFTKNFSIIYFFMSKHVLYSPFDMLSISFVVFYFCISRINTTQCRSIILCLKIREISFFCYSIIKFVFVVCRQLMNLSLSGNLAPEIGSLLYMERL
jgi:hypothetical protein